MLTLMHTQPTGLQMMWFLLSAVLWLGYFFLEGFRLRRRDTAARLGPAMETTAG